MIYYTVTTNTLFNKGDVIQLLNDTYSLNDSTGLILGSVIECNQIEDTNNYSVVIYAAGGGGSKIRLSEDWNGNPTRFEFFNNGIRAISSGGDGWIIPAYPTAAVQAGNLVDAAIYK